MELTIAGSPDLHVEGTVTIELPEYMTLLAPDELKEVQNHPTNNDLVLAAGVHASGDIVFLTVTGELRESNLEGLPAPIVKAWPIDHGKTIVIELQDKELYEIPHFVAIRNSRSLMNFGVMAKQEGTRISYIDK